MRLSTRCRPFSTSTWNDVRTASVSSRPIAGSVRRPSRRSFMPLVKAGRPIADPFVTIPDGEALPPEGAIIVGLARWQEERGLIEPRKDPVGLRLRAGEPVEQIAGD